MTAIPGIIHQSWKTASIPHDVYRPAWIESWKQAHADWRYILWTDDDNEQLVRDHFPKFLTFYRRLRPPIKKADFARFLYMYRFGGVYADLDFMCLENLTPLLDGHQIVVGQLSEDNTYYQIPNAFMASAPNNSFWLRVAEDAMNAPPHEHTVEAHAGPFRLQWALQVYKPEGVMVHGDGLIYPFDWIHFTSWKGGRLYRDDQVRLAQALKDQSVEQVAAVFPDAYCVTFWTHNW